MSDATNFPWVTQIGPEVAGGADGVVNSRAAGFYLSLGRGDDKQTYAWYSTTAGNTWVPIPNNKEVNAIGSNTIQWRFFAPPGVSFKFLMAPAK